MHSEYANAVRVFPQKFPCAMYLHVQVTPWSPRRGVFFGERNPKACFLGVEKGEDEVDVFFAVVLEQPWGHEMEKLIEVYLAVAFAIEI